MRITPSGIGSTYGTRLRQYQRRGSMVLWVGTGLVGLIGLATSDLSKGAPGALNAVVVSLIILGGGALAIARIQFEWAATQLDRAIQDGADPGGDLPGEYQPWPDWGEIGWSIGLICVPVAGIVYTVAVWLAVV